MILYKENEYIDLINITHSKFYNICVITLLKKDLTYFISGITNLNNTITINNINYNIYNDFNSLKIIAHNTRINRIMNNL